MFCVIIFLQGQLDTLQGLLTNALFESCIDTVRTFLTLVSQYDYMLYEDKTEKDIGVLMLMSGEQL